MTLTIEKSLPNSLIDLTNNFSPNNDSINLIAKYLDYTVGENPIKEDSQWKILFTNKTDDLSKGVIAIKPVEDLNEATSTMEIRRLYKDVEQLKYDFSLSFDVQIVAFLGDKRLILFPYLNGNRDTRLDINTKTAKIPLYQDNFNLLKNDSLVIEEDEFGFGEDKIALNLQEIFKRELTSHFRQTTNFYRKKLSELITATELKQEMEPLLDSTAKEYLIKKDQINLVAERSYTIALSTVVDTIILRQLMRRFLEGYYGPNSFELSGIALGVGDGTLDDAIYRSVRATQKNVEEKDIINLNRKKKPIKQEYSQISLFDIFDEEESEITSDIEELSESETDSFSKLIMNARKQFETVFDGDLFAGSVGEVTNEIEYKISQLFPEFLAKLWIDTSSDRYSFRYEDLPPSAIEEHYENSMSQNIQINFEDETPVVLYGSTEAEQKSKGAYYTDHQFVEYMVSQSVDIKFDNLIEELAEAVEKNKNIEIAIKQLLDFKVADLTCGGGSFLRGAFLKLASKHAAISSISLSEEILHKYPMFKQGSEGEAKWESYILNNMIYGVDFDYKAVLITSLTLSLTTIEHRDITEELPSLIGKNLIHQNSLINSVPFYKREEIYAQYKKEIKTLRKAKLDNDEKYEELRSNLQTKILKEDYAGVSDIAEFLHIEALEINLSEIFFDENGNLLEEAGFDCVIGNPPWDLLKPQEDEFYSEYDFHYPRKSTKSVKKKYIKEMEIKIPFINKKWKQYDYKIKQSIKYVGNIDNYKFQSWEIEGKKTGGYLNWYIVSVERFNQMLKKSGIMSILVPDNFATDANSTGIRHLVFDNYNIKEFLSFDNNKGIFPAVHRSYKFAVITYISEFSNEEFFDTFFYQSDINAINNTNSKFAYPIKLIKSDLEYTFVEVSNQSELNIITKMDRLGTKLSEIKNFLLSQDFNKTSNASKFKQINKSLVPLFEGKLMNQFILAPENKITEGISKEDCISKVSNDFLDFRIAIRTIARATDKRTLIATLLPKNSVATNSLHVQRSPHLMPIEEKLYYLGILNSYLLDFYLRNLVSLNINKRYLNKLSLIKYNDAKNAFEIQSIVKQLLLNNDNRYIDLENIESSKKYYDIDNKDLIAELNALVFKEYNLTREEIIMIMKKFESPLYRTEVMEEAQRIIDLFDSF